MRIRWARAECSPSSQFLPLPDARITRVLLIIAFVSICIFFLKVKKIFLCTYSHLIHCLSCLFLQALRLRIPVVKPDGKNMRSKGQRASYCGKEQVTIPLSRLVPIPSCPECWLLTAHRSPSCLPHCWQNYCPLRRPSQHTPYSPHSQWLMNPGCKGWKSFAVQLLLQSSHGMGLKRGSTWGLALLHCSPPYPASLLPVSSGHPPSMPCMKIPASVFFEKSILMRYCLQRAPHCSWYPVVNQLRFRDGTRQNQFWNRIF